MVALGGAVAAPAAQAEPTVTPTKDALELARAIAQNPAFVVDASFVVRPPAGVPTAIGSGDPLAGFPTGDDPAYGILSTGDATLAPTPNLSPRDGVDAGAASKDDSSDRDATILRIDVRVPKEASCLALDARLLTDEYEPFQLVRPISNPLFNDAFLAERNATTWKVDDLGFPKASVELVFERTPIQVIGGDLLPGEAKGTTYDAASPIEEIASKVTGGRMAIFLSVYDEGDAFVDTTVFLDDLAFGTWDDGQCLREDTVVVVKSTDTPRVQPGGVVGYTVDLTGLPLNTTRELVIVDVLPPGFTYVAGSTGGATSDEPAVGKTSDGQMSLTWALKWPGEVGTATVRFRSVAAATPGLFHNTADADVGPAGAEIIAPGFVLGSGPAAPVEIPQPPPSADLEVTQTQSPSPAVLGADVTYTLLVTNHGPSPATGVRVEFAVPAGVAVQAATASQGACAAGTTVACDLGAIGVGGTVTITILARATVGGSSAGKLSASALEADPVADNNARALETVVAAPLVVEEPEPVLGEKVAAEPVAGEVLVVLPGDSEPVPLADAGELPTGTRVDARNGQVEITAAVDESGTTQTATFKGAEFVVTQPVSQNGLTVLTLVGGSFDRCAQARARTAGRTLQKFVKEHGKPVRGLWGKGKGRFRTRGKWGSATVRGTTWFTGDLCSGTLVKVRKGVVAVRDNGLKKTVLVRTGQAYVAKRPAAT